MSDIVLDVCGRPADEEVTDEVFRQQEEACEKEVPTQVFDWGTTKQNISISGGF